jgi:hypothetical protein
MAELGPLMITAHNAAQAEYLVRSRAEQRGVAIDGIEVAAGSGGMWLVTVTVEDDAAAAAARLGDDTRILHIEPPGAGSD